MSEAWVSDPVQFGIWYGVLVGGVGGSLLGLLGAAVGCLAPRGRGERVVLPLVDALILLGAVQVVFGLVALLSGQPYAVWYPPLLCGAASTFSLTLARRPIRRAYLAAAARKMEAQAFRNG